MHLLRFFLLILAGRLRHERAWPTKDTELTRPSVLKAKSCRAVFHDVASARTVDQLRKP